MLTANRDRHSAQALGFCDLFESSRHAGLMACLVGHALGAWSNGFVQVAARIDRLEPVTRAGSCASARRCFKSTRCAGVCSSSSSTSRDQARRFFTVATEGTCATWTGKRSVCGMSRRSLTAETVPPPLHLWVTLSSPLEPNGRALLSCHCLGQERKQRSISRYCPTHIARRKVLFDTCRGLGFLHRYDQLFSLIQVVRAEVPRRYRC